jgi:hypothetical protein
VYSSRAGESALKQAGAPLDMIWDGTTATFPSFIVALCIRAAEARWDATDGTGIMHYTIGGKALKLLEDYAQITEADLEAERIARTNPRAIQNAKCFYKAIKSSISGYKRSHICASDHPRHRWSDPCLSHLLSL